MFPFNPDKMLRNKKGGHQAALIKCFEIMVTQINWDVLSRWATHAGKIVLVTLI